MSLALKVPTDSPSDSGRSLGRDRTSARVEFIQANLVRLGWLALTVLAATLVLLPLSTLAVAALSDGARGVRAFLDIPRIDVVIRNTVLLGVGSTGIAVVLGTALAWSTIHSPKRIQGFATLIGLTPLMLPAVASVMGWLFLATPRIGYLNVFLRRLPMWSGLSEGPFFVYSVRWIVLVTGFNLTSFVFLFTLTRLREMGNELESAAAVSGATALRSFFTITLPQLRPAIVYSAVVSLMLGLGQFTAPLLLGRANRIDVLTTLLYRERENPPIDFGLGASIALPLVVIGLFIVFFQQRIAGKRSKYTVTNAASSMNARKTSWLAFVPVLIYGIVAVALPITALVIVALSPFWSSTIDTSQFSTVNIFELLNGRRTREAIMLSITASLRAVAVALPIGFFAAISMHPSFRVSPIVRRTFQTVTLMPLWVPTALFGFAFLYAYTGNPFQLYGTPIIIVVAYITLQLPFALQTQSSTILAIPEAHIDASKVSGANAVRTLFKIILPLARRGMAAGAAIMFVLLSHEFAASMMIRTPRQHVMGTVLYEIYEQGSYPLVAAMALAMVVVTAIGVSLAMLIGGRSTLERIRG